MNLIFQKQKGEKKASNRFQDKNNNTTEKKRADMNEKQRKQIALRVVYKTTKGANFIDIDRSISNQDSTKQNLKKTTTTKKTIIFGFSSLIE